MTSLFVCSELFVRVWESEVELDCSEVEGGASDFGFTDKDDEGRL